MEPYLTDAEARADRRARALAGLSGATVPTGPLLPAARRPSVDPGRRALALDAIGRTPELDTDTEAFAVAQAVGLGYDPDEARRAIAEAPGLTEGYGEDLAGYTGHAATAADLLALRREADHTGDFSAYLDTAANAPDFPDAPEWEPWRVVQADARERTGWTPTPRPDADFGPLSVHSLLSPEQAAENEALLTAARASGSDAPADATRDTRAPAPPARTGADALLADELGRLRAQVGEPSRAAEIAERDAARVRVTDPDRSPLERTADARLADRLSTTDSVAEASTGAFLDGSADGLLAEIARARGLPVGADAFRDAMRAEVFGNSGPSSVVAFRTEAERDAYLADLAGRIASTAERAGGYRPARIEQALGDANGVGGVLGTLGDGEGVLDNVGTLVATNLARQPAEAALTTAAAVFGGPVGAGLAGWLASYNPEERAAIRAAVTEAGIDLTDADAVLAFTEDAEAWREINRRRSVRGTAVGLVNVLTAGVSSRLGGAAAVPGRTLGQRAALGGAGFAVETAGEAGGELAAQAAVGDDLDLGEAVIEAVAGAGQSAATTGGGAVYEGARRSLGRTPETTIDTAPGDGGAAPNAEGVAPASTATSETLRARPTPDALATAGDGPGNMTAARQRPTGTDADTDAPGAPAGPSADGRLDVPPRGSAGGVDVDSERLVPGAVAAGADPRGAGLALDVERAAAEPAPGRLPRPAPDGAPPADELADADARTRSGQPEDAPDTERGATDTRAAGEPADAGQGPVPDGRGGGDGPEASRPDTATEVGAGEPSAESRAAAQNVEAVASGADPLLQVGGPAAPVSVPVETGPATEAAEATPEPADAPRADGEAFDAYLGRARRTLLAEAEAEIDAALREESETAADPALIDTTAALVALAERTDNPATALRGWQAAREAEAVLLDPTQSMEAAIAEHLPPISSDEAGEFGDLSAAQRRAFFRSPRQAPGTGQGEGKARASLSEAAEEVSVASGFDVSAEDVAAFIRAYPNGPRGYAADVRRDRRRIEDRLRELTDGPISRKRVEGYLAALESPAIDAESLDLASATLGEILTATPGENPTGYGSRNALVTTDAYRDALAVLGRTAPFMNPGADPAVWKAAGQVAAYHSEALAREGVDSARRFGEFSARVLRDLGRDAEPHLQRLWDEASGAVASAIGPEAAHAVGPDARQPSQGPQDAAPVAPAQDAAAVVAGPPVDPGVTAPFVAAALTQAEIQRARDALGLADLGPVERQTWEASLTEVVRSGLHLEAGALAQSMLSPKGRPPRPPFSGREHVAVLVALARAQRTYRETAALVRETEAAGGPTEELQRDAARHLETIDLLTEAGRRSGTAAGSALAIRRLRLAEEAGRFTISRVLDDARVLKGASLTAEERSRLAELAETVEDLTARVAVAEAAAAQARAAAERAAAERTIEAAREQAERGEQTRASREARRYALREERAALLEDLGRLGMRMNDVTGLTAEGAVLVAKLARNLAADLGLTLAETVDHVRALLPDVTEAQVVAALARDPKATPPRRRTPEANAAGRAEKDLNAARVAEARAKKAARAAQADLAPRGRGDLLAAIAGLPRSVLATGDMSGVGNQAAPLIRRHPVVAARVFAEAFGTFFSTYRAERLDLAIRSDARQPKREAAGLYLAPVGEGAEAAKLTDREETFMSRLAERSPWLVRAVVGAGVGTVTFGPGVGTAAGAVAGVGAKAVMRASESHMVSFLNLLRVQVFDAYAAAHPDATAEELAGFAHVTNLLTGRGELSEGMARAGGWLLFSPRLTAARFQVLGAVLKPETPRAARLEALSSLVALVGVNAALLALADVAGGDETDVGLDPRSSDFGKLRWGSLRVDLFGGYSQVARLGARGVLAGTDAYGLTERPADRRDIDPLTEIGRMANAKKAPWIGATVSLVTGKDFMGDPIAPHEVVAQSLTPIGVQSAAEAVEADTPLDSDAARAAVVTAANFFGIATDTYDDPTQRATVLPFFERAHLAPRTSAPQGLDDAAAQLFETEYQARLAAKVEGEATSLRRIGEPDALADRLRELKAEAREEAAGVALGDPLRQGAALALLRRADYRPSPGRTEGHTAGQREARADSFAVRLAEMINQDAEVLERETDAEVLRGRLEDLAARARAEVDGDPLASALPWLQRADYPARGYPPAEMPEEMRATYEADFGRRLSARIEGEWEVLARYGDNTEGLKERLRWHAGEARREARAAAAY